jgi:uncharacterized tellurite resistance protein B-like protein
MIGKLKEMLEGLAPTEIEDEETGLELSVAVLLVEMARADHQLAEAEEATIRELLNEAFDLTGEAAETLLHEARVVAEDSVSMHDFTRAIHEGMDYAEKQRVIEMLWRVALADRSLDKYEDYLISKLGELLYVSRGDVIRLRHKVADQAG